MERNYLLFHATSISLLLSIFSALSLLVATKRYILSKTTFCYHVSDRPALDFLFNFIHLKQQQEHQLIYCSRVLCEMQVCFFRGSRKSQFSVSAFSISWTVLSALLKLQLGTAFPPQVIYLHTFKLKEQHKVTITKLLLTWKSFQNCLFSRCIA